MPRADPCERRILAAYEKGTLPSIASKAELARLKAAARVTALKDPIPTPLPTPGRTATRQSKPHKTSAS